MKKLLYCILCACLLLVSCKNNVIPFGDDTTHKKESKSIKPYVAINEEKAKEQVSKIEWEKIISDIPCDEYIQLDGLHGAPLSAALYKNEEKLDLDVNDPRLIRLLNFYNNEIYCGVYSYSQGTANAEYEEDKHCKFRLELTFCPVQGDLETIEASFDKMLIVDGRFYGVRTYTPFENYSYAAFLRIPLHDVGNMNWLNVFGF